VAGTDKRPMLIGPEQGRTLKNPLGGPLTFKVGASDTGGALTAFESIAAAGEGPPLHQHPGQDEVLYVIQGRLRVKLEGAIQEAPAGSFVFIPRGAPHTWQNAGDDEARLLVVFTPAAEGMEQFFERAAQLPDEAPAAEAFRQFTGPTSMEILGPPLAQTEPADGA
jgi:quercetin dioxygenase-like cupin family protein